MIIEDGKFYFIKDEFFHVFKDYGLMVNKENGNKRPCYFCFKDRKNKEIIWFVPLSTKYEKYKKYMKVRKQKVEIDRYITLFLVMFQEKKLYF